MRTGDGAAGSDGLARHRRLSHDQLKLDAKWHAEFDAAAVAITLRQFVPVEPQFRLQRQPRAVLAVGKLRLIYTAVLPVTVVQRRGPIRFAVPAAGQPRRKRWYTVEQWFQPGRIGSAAAAATRRLADPSVGRRCPGCQPVIVERLACRRRSSGWGAEYAVRVSAGRWGSQRRAAG